MAEDRDGPAAGADCFARNFRIDPLRQPAHGHHAGAHEHARELLRRALPVERHPPGAHESNARLITDGNVPFVAEEHRRIGNFPEQPRIGWIIHRTQ
ncbi:hypothetical protein HYW11_02590 [Candidatus Peregrinibacteria bacterium]|nr:hypothetical protein [Candidatus Peregrinibacteria bacterium]